MSLQVVIRNTFLLATVSAGWENNPLFIQAKVRANAQIGSDNAGDGADWWEL